MKITPRPLGLSSTKDQTPLPRSGNDYLAILSFQFSLWGILLFPLAFTIGFSLFLKIPVTGFLEKHWFFIANMIVILINFPAYLSIILGIISITRNRKSKQKKIGFAIAGICLGFLGLLITMLGMSLILSAWPAF